MGIYQTTGSNARFGVLNGTNKSVLAATGNSQATSALIKYASVEVTGSDGTKGVRLPPATFGGQVYVYNSGGSALPIYPFLGDDINDSALNSPLTINGKSGALFISLDGTTWSAIIGSPQSFAISSVNTEISSNPSTTLFTIPNGATGVCIYTGFRVYKNFKFNLYVKKNGAFIDAVTVLKGQQCERWLIAGSPGDTIALGTDTESIPLDISGAIVPITNTVPSAVTANANADDINPDDWVPVSPHVILPELGSPIKINSTGSWRIIYIKEYDGTNWSKIASYSIPPGYSPTIVCAQTRIALGTTDGGTISVTGPTGTVIGGTKQTYSIPFPAITGATYTPTDETTLRAACAAAVAGDAIQLPSSTITLTQALGSSNFTANIGAGRIGAEGITIFGSGSSSVIKVADINNGFLFTQTSATMPLWWRDFVLDCSNIATQSNARPIFINGIHRWQNVTIQNQLINTANFDLMTVNVFAPSASIDMLYYKCTMSNSTNDCWQFFGDSTSASRNMKIKLVNCLGTGAGSQGTFNNSQNYTTHNQLDIQLIACRANTDGSGNQIANGGATCWCYWTSVVPGSNTNVGWQDSNRFQCYRLSPSGSQQSIGTNLDGVGFMDVGNYWDGALMSQFGSVYGPGSAAYGTVLIEGNYIKALGTRAFFPNTATGSISIGPNIVDTANEGVRFNNITTPTGKTFSYTGLTIVNSGAVGTAYNGGSTAGTLAVLNTACKGNTNGTAGFVAATNTSNYGVYDPANSANFTFGGNDISNADAALDANLFPTASGNCDATGTAYSYIGSRDAFNFIHIYSSTTTPKGARGRPIFSQTLRPDIYV